MKNEVEHLFEESLARAREVGNASAESQVRTLQGAYSCSNGNIHRGYQMIVDVEGLASKSGDRKALTLGQVYCA